jgi:hypothetical protein
MLPNGPSFDHPGDRLGLSQAWVMASNQILYLAVKRHPHQGLLSSVWLVQPSVATLRAYHFLRLLAGQQHLQQLLSFYRLLCWAMSGSGYQEKGNFQNKKNYRCKVFLNRLQVKSYLGVLWTTFLFFLLQFCPTSTISLHERL